MRRIRWTAALAAAALVSVAGCGAGSPSTTGARATNRPARASAPPAADTRATPAWSSPVAPPSAAPAVPVPLSPTPTPRPVRLPPPPPSARSAVPSPPRPAVPLYHVFPVAGCSVSYAHSHHDYPATDIFAAAGCSVVAPVSGRVDEVSYLDRWNPSTNLGADRGGLAVSIVGVDGVRYYGSHLSSVAAGVRPGVAVSAGQLLGRVGSTGSARGLAPHLHFGISWPTPPGIWWVRRGEVYPWPYLDSWRAGGSSSPAVAVFTLRARLGVVPSCTAYC